jgi:cell division protein FtsL
MPAALIVVVMVAMISAVGLLYILQTNQVASLGYELSRLSQVREEKLAEQERLSAELAQAYSLAEIERISRDELGMEEAWSKQFLSVPMPAEPELPLPEQESAEHESWWGTVWDRLTGTGSATHEAEEPRP